MIRELLINLNLVYDGRFALQRSPRHAPNPVVKLPKSDVQHTPTLSVPNRIDQKEMQSGDFALSVDVLSNQEALSGHVAELTEAELIAIQEQRDKTKFRLAVEHCMEVKRGLAQGLSLSQIAKKNKGIKGLSLRAIKAISSAINTSK